MIDPIFVAYILIAAFFVLEGRLRSGTEAKRFDRGAADRGSTMIIGVAFGVCSTLMLLALLFNSIGPGQPIGSLLVGWIGIVSMLLGVSLRVWANRVLGAYYTRTLKVTSNQIVVDQGPYRLVRHPGYLGTIFFWMGGRLASNNWIALIIITLTVWTVYIYRIRSEEAMLVQELGEAYQNYRQRIKRLIPLIY
jgi:protein-S-isoprenylcysteine O-methyltransferase Ste14